MPSSDERSEFEILRCGTNEVVRAFFIDGVSQEELSKAGAAWRSTYQSIIEEKYKYKRVEGMSWRDFVGSAHAHALQQGLSLDKWPESAHWDWESKARGADSLSYGIECDDDMQGLMFVRTDKLGRLTEAAGKPLVYVDYLSSAPWNLPGLVDAPRFRKIGSVLMTAAVQLSFEQGWLGRVGLHALPSAEDFYRSSRKCGMTDLGIDPTYGTLRYFEMHHTQAQAFLRQARGEGL